MNASAICDDQFEQCGYTVVELLDEGELRRVREFYESLEIGSIEGNYCSVHEPNVDFKRRINSFLAPIIQSNLDKLGFITGKVMGGVFVVKAPTHEHVEPHQDPTLVDEVRGRSMNIWVPLQDVSTENGCLWMLPNSQDEVPMVRPGNGYDHPGYYDRVPKGAIWGAMTPIEMSAGEALVYDHRMLHGSKGNSSLTDRVAIVSGLCDRDAQLRFYHAEESDGRHTISEYLMGESDFLSFVDFVPQAAVLAGRTTVEPTYIDPSEFARRYGSSSSY